MTISYNISAFGICEQLIGDRFRKVIDIKDSNSGKSNKVLYQAIDTSSYGDVLLSYKEIFKLSEIIYNTLFETYPKLNELRDYFNSMSDILSKLNLPIIWATPSGLSIKQKYVEFTTYDIVNNILSRKNQLH